MELTSGVWPLLPDGILSMLRYVVNSWLSMLMWKVSVACGILSMPTRSNKTCQHSWLASVKAVSLPGSTQVLSISVWNSWFSHLASSSGLVGSLIPLSSHLQLLVLSVNSSNDDQETRTCSSSRPAAWAAPQGFWTIDFLYATLSRCPLQQSSAGRMHITICCGSIQGCLDWSMHGHTWWYM